jgi:small-conductance mechanosensitive channel
LLGLAGVVGLAVGFAFKDIAENFIASILLGVRRPFRIGDYVTVAGQAGVVSSLNTRATVLVTLEGQHIRIPNNIIYKEIMVNSSASPTTRGSFDVLIPYEASTATALDVMTHALREQEEILPEPPARALVDGLEPAGVRLRTYFWMPVKGVDGFKLQSDLKLRVKVALQQAGITPPPKGVLLSVAGRVPVEMAEPNGRSRADECPAAAVVTADEARANLRRDTRAAENASATPEGDGQTPLEHAMSQAETHVSEEGTNLLKNGSGADSGG